MPRFEVLRYDEQHRCHVVMDEHKLPRLVCVMTNGDFDESVTAESLIGKVLHVERQVPYVTIAVNVSIVDDKVRGG